MQKMRCQRRLGMKRDSLAGGFDAYVFLLRYADFCALLALKPSMFDVRHSKNLVFKPFFVKTKMTQVLYQYLSHFMCDNRNFNTITFYPSLTHKLAQLKMASASSTSCFTGILSGRLFSIPKEPYFDPAQL